jgi:oligoribonuclease
MSKCETNIVWLDCEMTGLDTVNDTLLEIATVVTNHDLQVLAEGPVVAIHQSDEVLAKMDSWNQRQHNRSGLVERVRASQFTIADAEAQTLEFMRQFVPEKCTPMAGNSICQDRRFLARLMPSLEAYFHYRNLDVSTLKILAQYWSPAIVAGVKKSTAHLALQDVHDSIEELRHYRKHFLADSARLSSE